jgi:hypothetical protein
LTSLRGACGAAVGVALGAALLAGCEESADRFFSGRPSGMAMAHNRVIEGSLESMVDLLRIPKRFPDATDPHKLSWQESVIAWWGAKRELVIAALPRLTAPELHSLEIWAAVPDGSRGEQKAAALAAFREALSSYAATTRSRPASLPR